MDPDAERLHALGLAAMRDRQPGRAVELFSQAIAADQSVARYFSNRGEAYRVSGDPVAAERDYRRAIALDPKYAIAHYNLGLTLRGQDRLDEAVASYRRAVELKPDYAKAYYNLANVLREQMNYADAQNAYRAAIQIDPKYVEAWNNFGQMLAGQRRIDEAVDAYSRAIELRPDHASSHMNRAMIRLMRGDYEQGWAEYEWRWKTPQLARGARTFPQPLWDGAELNGKTILLWAEQGLGDAIQFVRYAPLVNARGAARVVIECQAPVVSLLQTVRGVDQVIARGETLPSFDVHAPMLSLPRLLGTTVQTVPGDVPYLRADSVRVEHWSGRIAPHRRARNIGLVWAGNPSHVHDRSRSAPLAELRGLGEASDFQFFSLQKGASATELSAAVPELNLIDVSQDLNDFSDTAAAMQNLDAVVSVCTAVAHLAGALAKPVILMLFYAGEWRWLVGRQDSPWYPTMRIVQQERPGDWPGVAARVVPLLRDLMPSQ